MDANFRSISLDNPLSETENDEKNLASSTNETDTALNESIVDIETIQYKPLEYHWFYTGYLADKLIWIPLSYKDSKNLEKIYTQNQ